MVNFPDRLKQEILKGLPGTQVQWDMASSDRFVRDFPMFPGEDARVAAVLILLYPVHKMIHTVFMQRPDYNGVHSGQISFPGGKKEPGDESVIATALREADEETGIDQDKISILGTLTPLFIPVSNNLVTPIVGWAEEKPQFNYKTDEVMFLIDAEIEKFLDPVIIKTKPFELRGELADIKYFDYKGYTIWGATAMMLNELLVLIKRCGI